MKRALAVLLSVLLLAGCAGPMSRDDAFMSTVRESMPVLQDAPDADLIALGHEVCDLFDEYGIEKGFPELVKNMGSHEAASIGGPAVAAYCPEFSDYFS